MTVQTKLQAARAALNTALIERGTEIDLCLTALIAGEHILLVGPPGTGKSLLADSVRDLIDGNLFSILLTKFTTPEEVCGPISLAGLKADRYRRIIDAKLPTAHVAFLDEIFKASSAILNTMLTLLNERTFHNDSETVKCPLTLAIGASNEWPGSNGDGVELGALFDRFIFRRHVSPIATQAGLESLLWESRDNHRARFAEKITPAEIEQAHRDAKALPWSDEAKAAFTRIVATARTEGIQPGDRRLYKSVTACQAAAYLDGASEVQPEHLEVLAHILWVDPAEQPSKLAEIVGPIANPAAAAVNALLTEAAEIIRNTDLRELTAAASACKKLGSIEKKAAGYTGSKAASAQSYLKAEIRRIRLATVEAL